MSLSVPIDMRDITVTPLFKHITVENIPASERAGHAVMVTREMVEVRFAGTKNYSPQFPVEAVWRRDGVKSITYAERWADQYAEFLNGNAQVAAGTPLEMLRPFGITDSQLSLCRALKIYSIEALENLEGSAAKSMGMSSNALKEMARRWRDQQSGSRDQSGEIEALKAQIEELRRANVVPETEATPAEIEVAVAEADDELERLKSLYAEKQGHRPRGNPSVDTMRAMLADMGVDAA